MYSKRTWISNLIYPFVRFSPLHPMSSTSGRGRGRYVKVLAMAALLLCDLGLNCSLDYDSFNSSPENYPNNFLLGLLGLQVIIEISVFLLLFLAMADTFLFRVGLLGLLVRKFRVVLLIHPVYICFTLATGLIRVQRIVSHGVSLDKLWRDEAFVWMSSIQKCGKTFSTHTTLNSILINRCV